ncbi:MAG: restriction endonuclease subunit S, partial [Acidobacterium ailaaui]|nr:restriction endonuclease subunit S [Pseudacidobacterium ailaaui]
RSEVLFVDYMAEHLTPTGRAAVIVPEGIIFQSAKAYKQLRKMLVENYLYAVVSLPAGVFQPYSGVKTSILLMDKALAKKTDSILFIKIENDGFDLGAQRRPIDKNDLPDALNVIREYIEKVKNGKADEFKPEDKPCSALLVKKEKLAENGEYNLTGDRYRVVEKRRNQKWPMVRLGEVCEEIKSGFACGKSEQDTGEILHLRPMNISPDGLLIFENSKYISKEDFNEEYNIKSDDVLFNNTNSKELVGKTCYVPRDLPNTGFSNHLTRIRTNSRINARYLALILQRLYKNGVFLNLCHKWIGQAGINNKILSNVEIPLPPLEVQQEIVAEIEGYKKIIDGCRQVIDAWKPDVETYLEEELKTYLAEHPEKQEELAEGHRPEPVEGWPMVKLGEVCETSSGGTPSKNKIEYWENGKIPWLKSGEVSQGYIYKAKEHINEKGLRESSAKIFPINTVVVAMYGATAGQVGILKIPSATNQAVCGILPCEKYIPEFLYLVLKTKKDLLIKQSTGGAQPNISQTIIKNLQIPLPPLEVQQRIVDKIEAERKLINSLREMVKTYEEKIKRVIDRVWGE